MFAELVELGKRVFKGHDSLGLERCNWDIVIDENGTFLGLIPCDVTLEVEKLSAKKGKARLLLDKPEETLLGYHTKEHSETDDEKKYKLYFEKLCQYKHVKELKPVFCFYDNPQEVQKAKQAFMSLPQNKQKGNMTFMVGATRLVTLDCIHDAIKKKYEEGLSSASSTCVCAICGSDKYPVLDVPHGSIKMPKGQRAGSMLVSFNEKAFESYNLPGNLNSGICTNCARNYVEALKFLVGNGHESLNEKGEKVFRYTNRQKISDDTIAVFWTKEPDEDIDPFSDVCYPTEERMRNLFASVATGNTQRANADVANYFYCCTLSSAAARIAVRDWMTMSVTQYQKNLKQWFDDIATIVYGETIYPGIDTILSNCIKKKSKPTQSDFKARARIGSMLWHAALTNSSLPVMILHSVLEQIEHEKNKTKKLTAFAAEKTTVIRLIINRNTKNKYKMKEVLDEQNTSTAYLCGRLFALICNLQFIAQGAVNSSIKDRFFASASNAPAMVMGILLTKYVPIYEKKAKGAYSKDIKEIASRISHFPEKLSTIERGEFALGFYYQLNKPKASNN